MYINDCGIPTTYGTECGCKPDPAIVPDSRSCNLLLECGKPILLECGQPFKLEKA